MDEKIHLAIPAVGVYRQYAEVTAASAIQGCSLPIEVHFLDWTNVDRERMERYGEWHGSAIAWSRMFLPEILPDTVDWVISCDADILFRGDIAELWRLRNESYVVMGSRDSLPPWMEYDGRSICSGLTLINLRRWRNEGWSMKMAKWIEEHSDEKFLDQAALNQVFDGCKTLLPRNWGCFSGDLNETVDYDGNCAIHYVSDTPWKRGKITQLMSDAVVLWRQAAGLPCGGWRRWLYLCLRFTRPLWVWNAWMAWHFRNAGPRPHGLCTMPGRNLVIWAHGGCRSTGVLYREVQKRARADDWMVHYCEWGNLVMSDFRSMPLESAETIGDDLEKGRNVLRRFGGPGSVQVFCVYQNSSVWRRLIVEAKRGGARVVVYSEAPCEMCLGLKAALKRLYYRFALPWKLRAAVHAADLFISASGKMGIDRLVRLGWKREKIVPFGYSSPRLERNEIFHSPTSTSNSNPLRVLHLGSEAAYRGVGIAEEAAKIAGVELVKTGGKMSEEELVAEIRRADVVVGCGYCEPWGMRINDALLEGAPVIVSDGMGVAAVCDWYGCGCVVPKGDVQALAKVLKRCKEEPEFLAELRGGAQVAARELLPENRAKVFLNAVMSARPPEVCEANGMVVVDRLLRKHGVIREDEVWVHGMWTPDKWRKCIVAWLKGKKLVRMTHGSLSPIYLEKQGKWKKKLVAPIERWLFKRTDRVVVTCEAEKKWCQEWGLKNEFEILDLKKFFNLGVDGSRSRTKDGLLHVLYLGRRHPLKGVEFLERAVADFNQSFEHSEHSNNRTIDLRIVSDHFGEELERDWAWCDVLVLPTLSENFGLVVAEALERGKKVITTDGAPAWGEGKLFDCSDCSDCSIGYRGRLVCLKGYRDGTEEERVRLLKDAIRSLV